MPGNRSLRHDACEPHLKNSFEDYLHLVIQVCLLTGTWSLFVGDATEPTCPSKQSVLQPFQL